MLTVRKVPPIINKNEITIKFMVEEQETNRILPTISDVIGWKVIIIEACRVRVE